MRTATPSPAEARPFSLLPLLSSRLSPFGARLVAPVLDGALALSRLNALYAGVDRGRHPGVPFWDLALETLGVFVDVSPRDLAAIPPSGALVVVANHPFGGLDGLALLSVLNRVRTDVRVIGNHWLHQIPDLKASLVPVDAFGGREASPANATALRLGLRWLRAGHVVAVFPSGEVSHLALRERTVTDPPWHPAAARLAQLSSAAIVPVFFHGANSRLFQAAGLVHPRLRTLLLPREVLRRRASALRLSIGGPIPVAQVNRFDRSERLMAYARLRTFVLSGRATGGSSRHRSTLTVRPLVAAPPPSDLRREIETRGVDQRLLEHAPYSVWLTTRSATPTVIEEIGRLRELTFRRAGEGTGRSTDLDEFDDTYQHLFVWNDRTTEIVGAYRLGQTDVVVPRFGAAGLYTHTLFRLGAGFLDEISPALELGRSFVRPEYQREFAPLMLLWKGIGQVVATDPRYARLFGAVSVSRDYTPLSQQLLMTFLTSTRADGRLAKLVVPRHPPASRRGGDGWRALECTRGSRHGPGGRTRPRGRGWGAGHAGPLAAVPSN